MTTPNWSNGIPECPISAIYVAADGPNGWALSVVGELYLFTDSNGWEEVPPPATALGIIIKISSAPDSSLIAVTSYNEVFQFYSGTWTALGVSLANEKCIAAASVSTLVYRDSVGDFQKNLNGVQSTFQSSSIGDILQLTTVPALDHVWALTNDASSDNVFFLANYWRPIPGKNLKQFDLHQNPSNVNVQAYGVDDNGNGWLYNFTNGMWDHVSKPFFGAKFRSLESSTGYVWASLNQYGNNVKRGSI